MKSISTAATLFGAALLSVAPALARGPLLKDGSTPTPPFTTTLSNNIPLALGMDADAAARALGAALTYIKGRPGDEIYLTFRDVGGSELFPRKDRLFLQFRRGRLSAWKGDWGDSWMWQ